MEHARAGGLCLAPGAVGHLAVRMRRRPGSPWPCSSSLARRAALELGALLVRRRQSAWVARVTFERRATGNPAAAVELDAVRLIIRVRARGGHGRGRGRAPNLAIDCLPVAAGELVALVLTHRARATLATFLLVQPAAAATDATSDAVLLRRGGAGIHAAGVRHPTRKRAVRLEAAEARDDGDGGEDEGELHAALGRNWG